MAKKDFANLTTDLSALAASMPTQRPGPALVAVPAVAPPVAVPVEETPWSPQAPKLAAVAPAPLPMPITQFSLSLRKDLHKQLGRLASDADMTMRAFVLNALKEKGLAVTQDDLKDLRRERR